MAIQFDLFGGAEFVGDVRERLEHVLKEHPEARESFHLAMFYYWVEFDGLRTLLGDELLEKFKQWFANQATTVKTLQNRCSELQREQKELDASAPTRAWRDRQASAGPVGVSSARR